MFSSRHDKLEHVLSAVSACRYHQALSDLNKMDLSTLDRRDYGRALALELACLDGQGHTDRSAVRLESLLARLGADRRTLLGMGLQLSELHVAYLAERVLRRLGRLDRRSPLPRFYLARLLDKAGRLREAIREYDRVIVRDGAFPPTYVLKAECLRKLGDLPEAMVTLRWYLRLEPKDARGWLNLGDMHAQLHDDARALNAYQQAQNIEPHDPAVPLRRALLADARHDESSLATCLERLTELAPDQWQTLHVSALLAELQGNLWHAMECHLEAVELAHDAHENDRALTIAQAIRFAVQHQLYEQVEQVVDEVYHEQFFPAQVLSSLNQWHDTPLAEAREYFVLMDHAYQGALPRTPSPWVQSNPPSTQSESYRALRSAHVWARNRAEAAELALSFEERAGMSQVRVLQVQKRGGISLQRLGVAWRSDALLLYPV